MKFIVISKKKGNKELFIFILIIPKYLYNFQHDHEKILVKVTLKRGQTILHSVVNPRRIYAS